jgi:high affinity sulfate transporter 1
MQRPLVGLTRKNFLRETLAGVTLLAISVPINIGYAQIAGLPATAGLYALVVPTIVFALLASSRQVVASTDAAGAALVSSSLIGLAIAGSGSWIAMAAAQAILGGLFFIACAVFKLGFVADYLSRPILVGFVGGLALDIMTSQVARMLGISLNGAVEFWEKVTELLTHLADTNPWSVMLAIGSLAVLILGRRFARRVPWALIVMVIATIVTMVADLAARGVATLGEVAAGPPVFAWPQLTPSQWVALIPSSLALAAVTVAEGLLISRSYASRNGYATNPNRDLLAFGAANIAAGLSSSYSIGSSTSRTAAMDDSGSRTQWPSIVLAGTTLLLLLFGTALLADIPSPTIGAIVAVAVARLIGLVELRTLWAQSRSEFLVGIVCFVSVLVVGPIGGIGIAFVLSLLILVSRISRPAIDVLSNGADPSESLLDGHDAHETVPGVTVLRFAAPLFFANATALPERVREVVAQAPTPTRALVIDLEAVTDIDVTAAEMLVELVAWCGGRGIQLAWSRVRPELHERLAHFGLLDGTLEFRTNRAAVTELAKSG